MERGDVAIDEPDSRGMAAARPEFPELAVREAIVNAVCHRDYESNGSVQVMLFRDRLEIINPGCLPKGWDIKRLLGVHDSQARNPVIALALTWAGFVEKSGNGIDSIISRCVNHQLEKPEFRPDNAEFDIIIWRKKPVLALMPTAEATGAHDRHMLGVCQACDGHMSLRSRVIGLLQIGELSRREIANELSISWNAGYLKITLDTLIEDDLIEYTIPNKPRSRFQKYRLTAKGCELSKGLQP